MIGIYLNFCCDYFYVLFGLKTWDLSDNKIYDFKVKHKSILDEVETSYLRYLFTKLNRINDKDKKISNMFFLYKCAC